jgi:hypothetical protein
MWFVVLTCASQPELITCGSEHVTLRGFVEITRQEKPHVVVRATSSQTTGAL